MTEPRPSRLPWLLTVTTLVLAAAGATAGGRSMAALLARADAAEAEARTLEHQVAELQMKQEAMAARMRGMEAEGARLVQQNTELSARLDGMKKEPIPGRTSKAQRLAKLQKAKGARRGARVAATGGATSNRALLR